MGWKIKAQPKHEEEKGRTGEYDYNLPPPTTETTVTTGTAKRNLKPETAKPLNQWTIKNEK